MCVYCVNQKRRSYVATIRPTDSLNTKETGDELGPCGGNWKTFKGQVQQQWGKLTDDDLDVIAGRREELLGRIQNAYGMSRDDADRQIREWEKNQTIF